MGEIIARNVPSWLKLLINYYCCIQLVVYITICIKDARLHSIKLIQMVWRSYVVPLRRVCRLPDMCNCRRSCRGIAGSWLFTAFESLEVRFITVSSHIVGLTRLKKGWAGPIGRAVWGRLLAGIVGSNPVRGLDICLLWVLYMLSGRCLFDGPITRPEESCRAWWVSLNLRTS